MSPDLLDTALKILGFSITFVVALFLPLLLQLLLLFAVSWAFNELVGWVSSTVWTLLSLIGTPVHEFSHALGCLITLCGVDAIKPLSDKRDPGYVLPKRPSFLASIVASVAPLFGGTLVLWLTASYVIPGFGAPVVPPPQLDLKGAASLETVLQVSAQYVGQFIQTTFHSLPALQWGNWRTYVGLYIALSVGLGLAPSPQDLKILAGSLPLLFLVGFAMSAWLYLAGDAEAQFLTLQQTLVPRLLDFSTAVTYAFLLTSLGMVIFMPLRIWQKWRSG
ncbi:MAG: hypothetical protein PVH17_08015 [Anaerolineae bacterium]|jgi:hypothetical protein